MGAAKKLRAGTRSLRPELYQLDGSVVAGSGGEPSIACEQWSAEPFGNRDIRRVIR
jgi:hypothetical protein